MPRKRRIHIPGGFYHVTLRGNHQRAIFRTGGDLELLEQIVARAVERYDVRVHAYCWMTNHIHLLLQVGVEPLSSFMRQVASEFARTMQFGLKTSGHFFERRYHATIVDAESYLKEVVRYIHLNPVAAGIAEHALAYRWSSHHDYLGAVSHPWVTTDFVLQLFGGTRGKATAAYEAFMSEQAVPEWAEKLEFGGGASDVLGDDVFVAGLKTQTSRPRSGATLDELVAEACGRFMVSESRLASPVRDPYLAKVRAWIASQAQDRGVATLSAVARRVGRSEATIRQSLREFHSGFKRAG